jgi:predicted dehydrogenase
LKKTFKVGIIGCGNIGGRYDENGTENNIYTHAGMYHQRKEFNLVCAADTNVERLKQFGRYWNVERLYKDCVELFKKETLDIISIATPDETHHKLILEALQYNPPQLVFTEKPLSINLQQSIDIYEQCKKKNIKLIVDYVRRWDENHQSVKKFLQDGKLGSVQTVLSYYVRGLRHNGCQMINLIQFLFGSIKSVQAVGATDLGTFKEDTSQDLRLILEDGTPVYMIALDQKGYGYSIFEMDIIGQDGRLRLLDGGQRFQLNKVTADPQFSNFNKLSKTGSPWEKSTYGKAMTRAGEEISSFLKGQSSVLENTVEKAIDDLCVIEAALESARNNNIQTVVKRI